MDLLRQVDAYCERMGFEFWAEPINAVTNLAFIVAALLAFAVWTRQENKDAGSFILIALIAIIGTGSFLFHTYATIWAMLLDVIPIMFFMLAYFYLATRHYLHSGILQSIVATLGFLGVLLGAPQFIEPYLGSSGGYVPALLAMWGFAAILMRKDPETAKSLALAGAVFTVSLTFRTLDEPVCAQISFGTHFLWHIFNAIVLYVLTRAFIRFKQRKNA
ncbi:ceramidase domain-containing protein [Pseudovibrio sp. SPO723]|uniref:ceramidase domain-containing protein n=1 Tax=Nesiotobacter zosterae TaxID=392721 RepID=UPI0029C29D20|nr:ceramidase domain-containing protein [Pseudovibrio sp. SPO723]MDX5593063.1 ceramidase domain-containing protein [Pseudovibrio sp. SPO723]